MKFGNRFLGKKVFKIRIFHLSMYDELYFIGAAIS